MTYGSESECATHYTTAHHVVLSSVGVSYLCCGLRFAAWLRDYLVFLILIRVTIASIAFASIGFDLDADRRRTQYTGQSDSENGSDSNTPSQKQGYVNLTIYEPPKAI